ncbi:hypothetical protein PVAND_016586 [Polypedilum vanderplanki]|uniref:Uncharacterized protein n=1 Tax=Polypedilum vanderplanki TaxID=319348 RepID=A0A9J6BFJ7_POLVA|nr:hypothetical protein PVAND_016586 [Polypedilum vanderplanki]
MKLKTKILSVFLIFMISSTSAQDGSLVCSYWKADWTGWLRDYYCMLTVDNPQKSENFSSISGIHVDGYNNSNVDTVYTFAARDGTAKVIPTRICIQFPNLRDLWLDKLEIELVTDKTFNDCQNLESLYLSHNDLRELPVASFAKNSKLKLLDLGKNHLKDIPNGIFTTLAALEHLYLDENHLKLLNSDWFATLVNLKELKLAKNEIFELQVGIFASLDKLELLDVSDNHLTVLNSNSFAPTLVNFHTLLASHNQINAIDPNFFHIASGLANAELNGNLCIDEAVTDNHENLSECFDNFDEAELSCTYMNGWLTFYFCMLDIKNPHGRDDFLTISGNHRNNRNDSRVTAVYGDTTRVGYVKNVPSIICKQFNGLLDLYLDGLNIEIVTEKSFEDCRMLKSLYLSENKIDYLKADTFKNNEQLEILDLGKNLLTFLPSSIFASLTNLKQLYLDDNSFKNLVSDVFKTLKSLETLWLSNCGISTLQNSWFDSLEELHVLHLENNEISTLQNEIFAANRGLKVLNLDNNKLKLLTASSFSTRMDQFTEIYANHNQFEEIDKEFFEIAETLKIAEFEGNFCIDEKFENFDENREENLAKFSLCFKVTFETTTVVDSGNSQWNEFVRFIPVFVVFIIFVKFGL